MIIAHFHVARQLASPRGGHPTPRRGGLILRSICTYMNEIYLFRTILARFSLLTAGRFSRSQLRCTQRSRMYSRGKLGPWSCSAARALGVTIISSWQVLTALRSASPSVAGLWKPNKLRFLLCCCCCMISYVYHNAPQAPKLSAWWQLRYNSSRTTSSSPYVTATDGSSVVWACLRRVFCRRRE